MLSQSLLPSSAVALADEAASHERGVEAGQASFLISCSPVIELR